MLPRPSAQHHQGQTAERERERQIDKGTETPAATGKGSRLGYDGTGNRGQRPDMHIRTHARTHAHTSPGTASAANRLHTTTHHHHHHSHTRSLSPRPPLSCKGAADRTGDADSKTTRHETKPSERPLFLSFFSLLLFPFRVSFLLSVFLLSVSVIQQVNSFGRRFLFSLSLLPWSVPVSFFFWLSIYSAGKGKRHGMERQCVFFFWELLAGCLPSLCRVRVDNLGFGRAGSQGPENWNLGPRPTRVREDGRAVPRFCWEGKGGPLGWAGLGWAEGLAWSRKFHLEGEGRGDGD